MQPSCCSRSAAFFFTARPYDAKSKAEYVVTGGAFGRQVSVQPAQGYANRFFHFMHETVGNS